MSRMMLGLVIWLAASVSIIEWAQAGGAISEPAMLGQQQEDPADKIESAILPDSDLPRDLLALDYLQCYQGCAKGFRKEVCEPLCLCVVRELQRRFAKDSYIKLRLQMSLNTVDPENRILLDRIAVTCTKSIEDKGIEIVPEQSPEGAPDSAPAVSDNSDKASTLDS